MEDLKKEKAARRGKKVSREIVNHLESIVGSDVSEGNVSRTTAVKALAEQMQVSFTSLKRVWKMIDSACSQRRMTGWLTGTRKTSRR